jgi:hypothetical protein
MATRLKTVKYAFPVLASLVNNTLTNLTQITLNLPETAKVFRSVVAHVTMNDVISATGGTLTTKTLNLRLGAAAYTSIANTQTLTNSGENAAFWLSQNFTSHFVTNWTGTSMTCDFQLQINQTTGTSLGMLNVCVELVITYEYDDASATHIKTVMIPLNAPVGSLTAAAVTYDTIPALDTYLPEASKVYRDIYIVIQGNTSINGTATNHTVTLNVGAATHTTGGFLAALASDCFIRYIWDLTSAYPSTAAAQAFQMLASVATRMNHLQAYLVVTYEFNPATSTSIMNSVMLPMEVDSPMGGPAATDAQRGERELFIQEPGTITTNRVAFFAFWQQAAAIAGLNMRIGTGAFVAYTDIAAVLCGGNAAMIRNDAAFTLVRGRNELNFDCYRTDLTDFGWNVSGFWLVNYTSGKATQGVGAHNHSVEWSLQQHGTTVAATSWGISALAPVIPETKYYITALGTQLVVQTNATTGPGGVNVTVERLAAEGGVKWEEAYTDISQHDSEVGVFLTYSQIKDLFDRWPGDPDANRMDLEVARRWGIYTPGTNGAATVWVSLNLVMTYHTITYTVAGNITNSAGGTVTINVCRANTGERVLSTSRVGNGAYNLPWYDNTENLYVEARESATLLGRSDNGLAA